MSMCGRDYDVAPEPDQNTKQMASDGFNVHRLHPVFRDMPLIGAQVYSDETPGQRARNDRQPGAGCGGSLIIIDSPGHYRVYALSGGP
jgi:hypothetical protein